MSEQQQHQAAFSGFSGFLTYIGELRSTLMAVAVFCVVMKPFASTEIRYHNVGVLPDVIVPVTVIIHNFWAFEDPMAKANEMAHFLKNILILAAALAFLGLPEPTKAT